jgi:uncharacterized membrane protein YedE/YeeE
MRQAIRAAPRTLPSQAISLYGYIVTKASVSAPSTFTPGSIMTDASASLPLERRAVAPWPRWATLGVLFGLLSAAAIALYGPIGVSGTYPRFVGAFLRRLVPDYAAANPYLVKMGSLVTPETMLVVGLLIGGFLAARLGRTHAPSVEIVHARETTSARRYADAFLGGFLILFGARLAGGCTSGHIISGMTQLAVSSTIFAAAVFAGGIGTARLLTAWRAQP